MEWCVNFPKEQVIMSRPSLRKACGGNRNAGKLLGYFLYRVSARENAKIEAERINELRRQQGQKPDQDTSTSICRTQPQIVSEMDEELSDRTLRDDAIPCLKELHFLTTEEIRGNRQFTIFTVDLHAVQEAIFHPELVADFQTLPYFLALHTKRAEKWKRNVSARKRFRAELLPDGGATLPDGGATLPDGQAQAPGIVAGPENGIEEAWGAGLEGDFETPKNKEKSNYKNTLQEEGGAFATAHARALFANDVANLPEETVEDDPDATIKQQATPPDLKVVPSSQQTLPPMEPAAPESPPPADERGSSTQEAAEPKETAAQRKKRLKQRQEDIIALYCELLGRKKIVLSKDNLEGAKQLAEAESSDEEITQTYNTYKDHSFWGKQLHLKNIARLLDTTVTQGHKKPLADTGKPAPEPSEFGHSDFDIYVGNGPEERRAVYEEALRRQAEGTLLE